MRQSLFAAYAFDGLQPAFGSPAFNRALAAAHQTRSRPRCLCTEIGVPMCVAHLGSTYILKRMPGSGALHARDCPSSRTAICISTDSSRSPSPPGAAPQQNSPEERSVRTRARGEHQLLADLQTLWRRAGLNYWRPEFEGKRHWATVRTRLLQAAAKIWPGQTTFVPEPFAPALRYELAQQRRLLWSNAAADRPPSQRCMRTIAEIKDIDPEKSLIVLKHLPDLTLRVGRHQARQLISLRSQASPSQMTHLILIGFIDALHSEKPRLIASAAMTVDARWMISTGPRHALSGPESQSPAFDSANAVGAP